MKNFRLSIVTMSLAAALITGCGVDGGKTSQVNQTGEQLANAKTESTKSVLITNSILGNQLYLRGGFNAWGTATPFEQSGENLFVAELEVIVGVHPFKIATGTWSQEWVVNSNAKDFISLDTKQTIKKNVSGEDNLFVRQAGVYRFELSLSSAGEPTLVVKRIADLKSDANAPHKAEHPTFESTYAKEEGGQYQAKYSITDESNGLRTYLHSTNQPIRDPGDLFKTYSESADLPLVRTGNIEFDALFALAINEMGYVSVDTINDGSYNNGDDIDCKCFKTGEKWAYVWTRDLSYAADLSLSFMAPERVKNSLNFKLSNVRDEVKTSGEIVPNGLHIIQDTGSGGSWPISTDRMTWSIAADSVLNNLPAPEREVFAARALEALANSIKVDRIAAFDKTDGLYTGEQSFLDWRNQTYAEWIVEDLASMGSAKALSTNVTHYSALQLAHKLAKAAGFNEQAKQYANWAADLKKAINAHLWLEDQGLYSSLTAGHFDNVPMAKFDWLGQSLAILYGIADEQQAASILARYPHGPMGAPVIFPQQPDMPVYHNRAIWPFVTAYGLKAAVHSQNTAVANAAYDTLIRGAALNMSNMENLEWLTAQPLYLDPTNPWMSGPVINSNYQLWSVAGYLNMVVENVYGINVNDKGISFKPFITTALKQQQFADTDTIKLSNMQWANKHFNVEVRFPENINGEGYFAVKAVTVNGKQINGAIAANNLKDQANVVIELGDVVKAETTIAKVTSVAGSLDPNVIAPVTPIVTGISETDNGTKVLINNSAVNTKLSYSLIKNGKLVLSQVSTDALVDTNPTDAACYSVAASYIAENGAVIDSHHTRPLCIGERQIITADSAKVHSNKAVVENSAQMPYPHVADWGMPQDMLEINQIKLAKAGSYAFQIEYVNTSNTIGEGVTSGVKRLLVKNKQGKLVSEKVIQLPHTLVKDGKNLKGLSTPLVVNLDAGEYEVEVKDFFNMSYLSSNSTYTRAGGINGPRNHFDFISLQVLAVEK